MLAGVVFAGVKDWSPSDSLYIGFLGADGYGDGSCNSDNDVYLVGNWSNCGTRGRSCGVDWLKS